MLVQRRTESGNQPTLQDQTRGYGTRQTSQNTIYVLDKRKVTPQLIITGCTYVRYNREVIGWSNILFLRSLEDRVEHGIMVQESLMFYQNTRNNHPTMNIELRIPIYLPLSLTLPGDLWNNGKIQLLH